MNVYVCFSQPQIVLFSLNKMFYICVYFTLLLLLLFYIISFRVAVPAFLLNIKFFWLAGLIKFSLQKTLLYIYNDTHTYIYTHLLQPVWCTSNKTGIPPQNQNNNSRIARYYDEKLLSPLSFSISNTKKQKTLQVPEPHICIFTSKRLPVNPKYIPFLNLHK